MATLRGRYEYAGATMAVPPFELFLGQERATKRTVTIYHLPRSQSRAFAGWCTLVREWADLCHPHLLTLLDCVEEATGLFLVVEALPAASLATLLTTPRYSDGLPLEQVKQIGLITSDALQALHTTGQAHGYILPETLWLMAVGDKRVIKLGLPVVAFDPTSASATILQAALAPERVASGQPTAASDLYMLGTLLYYLLTLRLPIMEGIAGSVAIVPPNRYRAGISDDLNALIMALLQTDPMQRPPSAAVYAHFRGKPTAAPSPTVPNGGRRWLAQSAPFVFILLIALTVLFHRSGQRAVQTVWQQLTPSLAGTIALITTDEGNVALRTNPTTESTEVHRLEAGTPVVLLAHSPDEQWVLVQSSIELGWVYEAYVPVMAGWYHLPIHELADDIEARRVTTLRRPGVVNADMQPPSLNVRDTPSLSGALVGVLLPATPVAVIRLDKNGEWAYISAAEPALEGWVAAEYLSMGEE